MPGNKKPRKPKAARKPKPPAPGPVLDRAAILAADDMRRERLAVPDWGGDVFVRTLTGKERERLENAWRAASGAGENARASLLAVALVDEAGKRLFTDADIEALADKAAPVLDRLFDVACILNRIGDAVVEELAGN